MRSWREWLAMVTRVSSDAVEHGVDSFALFLVASEVPRLIEGYRVMAEALESIDGGDRCPVCTVDLDDPFTESCAVCRGIVQLRGDVGE